MKALAIIAGLFACVNIASAGPAATAEQALSSAGKEAVKAYRDSVMLRLPAGVKETRWRVADGNLQFFDQAAGDWALAPSEFLPRPLSGTWEGFDLGGVPAVGREPFFVEFGIGPEFDFKALGFVDNQIIEVGRKLVRGDSGLLPEFSVFVRNLNQPEPTNLGSFRILEDAFQYRLASVSSLSGSLIGIIASTEHADVNALVIFDVTQRQPIGYLPFSEFRYLPYENAFWAAPPVTRARAGLDENALAEARAQGRVIPIFVDGKLNPELAESDLFAAGGGTEPKVTAQPTGAPEVPTERSPEATSAHSGSGDVATPERSPKAVWILVALGVVVLGGIAWAVRSKRNR